MTLVAFPFTTLRLVAHAGGGAILRNHAGYIAGTLIDPSIVAAFSTASSVLASLSSGAASIATSPVVMGGAAVAVVAVGTYCYFYGLPPVVIKALLHAGLGVAKKTGFGVAAPKLAVALVLLGAAGYLSYEFFRSVREVRARTDATAPANAPENGRLASETAFGTAVWHHFGQALWSSARQASMKARLAAQEAVEKAGQIAEKSAAVPTTLLAQIMSIIRRPSTGRFWFRP